MVKHILQRLFPGAPRVNLGALLKTGEHGADPEHVRAVGLFTRTADAGFENSIVHVARMLGAGAEGVDVDHARAIVLFTRVIEEGKERYQIGLARDEVAPLQQSLQSDGVEANETG